MEKNYEEALRRIMRARETNSKKLDLSGLKLTQLPPSLGELSELESLDLSKNLLDKMPMEVMRLKKLRKIIALHNNIRGGIDFSGLQLLEEFHLSTR